MPALLKYFWIILMLALIGSACNKGVKTSKSVGSQNTADIQYAKGFDIVYFEDHIKLIIKAPYLNSEDVFEYTLCRDKMGHDKNCIQIPLNSVVVTSTTHIPFLELLEVEDKLTGFPNTDYISSPKTRALVASGNIFELGNEEQINTELLMDLSPELVIGFTLYSNNKMFSNIEKMGIPVLLNGDWLEESPLGRAEWIKFFGLLFDKQVKADSIFSKIENNYLNAKKIALSADNQPTILSGGLYKDIWNLPAGDSFEATFLADANTKYLYADRPGKGSLSLNIENVFTDSNDADYWISPSYHTTLESMKKSNDIYSKFKSFQEETIFTFVNKTGETGGVIYFELAPERPDLVLQDLIKITHPELLKDYELTFFEKLH